MPTSSQSQILSVVDHQLLQQQQGTGQDGIITKPSNRIPINQTSGIETKRRQSKDDRRLSTVRQDDDDDDEKFSPPNSNLITRRQSSTKTIDEKLRSTQKAQKPFKTIHRKPSIHKGFQSARTSQRNDLLHVPVVNLNTTANNSLRNTVGSSQYRRSSFYDDDDDDGDDDEIEMEYKQKLNLTTIGNNSLLSDLENLNDDEENLNHVQSLNESARRLLVLGTIRPSKSFYKDLSESDIEYLMDYFRRMRNTNRKISSDEMNQELKAKLIEYKPKMFFDSAGVTRIQVNNIEKMFEPYADQIRSHQAELLKLDNPLRFIIKSIDRDAPLITIPREYNDCLLTLVCRTDPLRKSNLITELIPNQLVEDVKANSLDISYFPGGVNYDVPHEEIDETGQMKLDTYQKLKRRLNATKVWYFTAPPEKKPNALLAILPSNISIQIDHQRLFDCLMESLKTSMPNENLNIQKKILSIEFIPLSCILDSYEVSNQFIIDCDTNETKQQLLDKPLKMNLQKQLISIELQSYDENIRREYEKSVKAEKYRELINIHDQAVKRKSTK